MFSKFSTNNYADLPNLASSNETRPNKKGKVLLAISALTLGTILNFTLLSRSSLAQSTCQCVGYVQNRFRIYIPVEGAKDSVSALPNLGFQRIPNPQVGAIVVFQPSFGHVDQRYGHIGVVESVNSGGITVRSANQASNRVFSEANCNNVSVVAFNGVAGRSDVSFWVRGNSNNNNNRPTPPTNNQNTSQSNGFRAVNFSAWVMSSNGANLRTSPQLSARSNQNVAYRQSISFDGWTYGETVNDLSLGTPDARWYRVAGTNYWLPSAYVNGNAPNSRAMP